jgi:hypothetical protein
LVQAVLSGPRGKIGINNVDPSQAPLAIQKQVHAVVLAILGRRRLRRPLIIGPPSWLKKIDVVAGDPDFAHRIRLHVGDRVVKRTAKVFA